MLATIPNSLLGHGNMMTLTLMGDRLWCLKNGFRKPTAPSLEWMEQLLKVKKSKRL